MMKRILVIAVAVSMMAFFASDLIGGRGRGGGGRGGGGFGGARPSGGASPSVSPRPSVPRPSAPVSDGRPGGGLGAGGLPNRPSGSSPRPGTLPAVGKGPVSVPSKGQLQNFLDIGGSSGIPSRPITLPAPGRGSGAVADFFAGKEPGKVPGQGPGIGKNPGSGLPGKGVGKLPGAKLPGDNRPGRIENRPQRAQQRQSRRQEIRNEFRDHYPRWDFWTGHPRWAQWRVNRPYRWATVALLTGWCGYGAASYYDYGENIYYQDGAVYSDGQQVATDEAYAAAAEQIATTAPTNNNPEWMSLGVFAITQDGQASGPAPTMFLQLDISKEGIIAGTLRNTTTNVTEPVEGMVDKSSQRAAWVVSGKTRPIMETGIFNLTKDTAPALIHFADGQTQQWLLVRMDEPKDEMK